MPTDAQSSGGGYGLKKAVKFKQKAQKAAPSYGPLKSGYVVAPKPRASKATLAKAHAQLVEDSKSLIGSKLAENRRVRKVVKKAHDALPDTPAPVTDAQSSGGSYGIKRSRPRVAPKTAASRTPVTDLVKTVGPTAKTGSQTPLRRAVSAAVPINAREKAKDQATVEKALAAYRSHDFRKAPDPADVQAAIKHGNAKVGGSYLLQKEAHLEVTKQGDIAIKMNRRYLPDVTDVIIPGDYKPGHVYAPAKVKAVVARSQQTSQAGDSIHVAGQKVLEQTVRPAHAIAAGTNAALHGKNVLKAAGKGIAGKDKTLFSDVLRGVGAGKLVSSVGGTALDIFADPTTYASFGTASIARKAAEKAAADAEKASLKAGLTTEQAAKMGARAHAQTLAKKAPGDTKGVTVKFAGHEVPGVRKATGKTVGKASQKVGGKVAATKPGQHLKIAFGEVNPKAAEPGLTAAQHQAAKSAARTARSTLAHNLTNTRLKATALRKKVGKNDQQVIDAIESGKTKDLPPALKSAAADHAAQMRYADRLRRQAGIKGGTIDSRAKTVTLKQATVPTKKGRLTAKTVVSHTKPANGIHSYVRHEVVKPAEETAPVAGARVAGSGKRVVVPSHGKSRAEERDLPLADLRKKFPGEYNEDLPVINAGRMAQGHESVAQSELNRRLADLGEEVKPSDLKKGASVRPAAGESVYHLKGSDLRKVAPDDVKTLEQHHQRVSKFGKPLLDDTVTSLPQSLRGGRFVVLNDKMVERAYSSYKHSPSSQGIARGFDKVTGGFKRVATATPAFHIRNLVGDTANAYQGQSAHKLAANIGRSRRMLGRQNAREEAVRKGKPIPAKSPRLVTRLGGRVPAEKYGTKVNGAFKSYDELADEAAKTGGLRSGYIAKELPELQRGGEKVGKIRKSKVGRLSAEAGRRTNRAMQNREDLARGATYLGGRKAGKHAEEAAQHVAEYHFDYADLSAFERNFARRAMPFYTFTARNIPRQAKTLASRPGKFASFEKLREETAKAFGIDPTTYQNDLSERERRNLPIPVKLGGKQFTISGSLPLTDLNEVPGTMNPVDQAGEWINKAISMGNPVLKDPLEISQNYSFFFRDKIEDDNDANGGLVAAPSFVGSFSPAMKKKLGIKPTQDRKTGKPTWSWPGKVDYVAHAVPGLPSVVQTLLSGTDRTGKSGTEKTLGLVGLKVTPTDAASQKINELYDEAAEVNKQASRLRKQLYKGKLISADNPTPGYTKLLKQASDVQHEIYALSKGRGDAVPMGKAPPAGPLTPQEKLLAKLDDMRSGSGSEQQKLLDKLQKMRAGG